MSSELKNPDFHARLTEVMGEERHRPFAWAARIGISKGAFSRIWNDGTVPGPELLIRIHKATGVSVDWLLTGEGPVYAGKPGAGTGAGGVGGEPDDYTYIPLYDLKAAAGTGEVVYQEDVRDFLCFKTQWIKTNLRGAPKELFLLHVQGDSMEPTLRSGDIVLIDRSITNPQQEGIYLVRLDSAIMVKRVQILEGNRIELSSDNQRYKPIVIDMNVPGEMCIIGRVACGTGGSWYRRR